MRFAALFLLALSSADASHPNAQLADAALDAWQLEDARQLAETWLMQAPSNPHAQLLAAEVLHHEGQHVEALALWRSAHAQAGPRAHVLQATLFASAGYAPYFHSVPTAHFLIRAMDKDAIVAAYAGTVLEAAYERIGADLNFLPAERGEKIVVEIYPDARGLAGATGLTLKEIETSGTIAVCKFHRLMITSPLATADGYAWADTLAHEFVHLIISKRSHNSIPIWLHEGIAKYFESRWKGPAGQALTPYSEKLLAQAVAKQDFITFAQMHPSMAKLPSQDAAALAFAEVFTVIEFIVSRHGAAAIAEILRLTGEGVPLEKAFTQVLHLNLAQLETAWKHALSRRNFRNVPYARPQTIRLADAATDPAALPSMEDMADKQVHDWARLGELLQLRHRPKAAIIEYEKATGKSGLRYGSLVNQLARSYIEVGQLPAAETLLQKSLAEHPDDSDAHLLAGRLALNGSQWATAQAHYEAVRLYNPFNPEIHAALATLYEHAKKTAAAQQEKDFLEVARKPRALVDTTPPPVLAPPLPVGYGLLRLVSQPWRALHLGTAQSTQQTPLWDYPLPAGAHPITWQANGQAQSRTVTVEAGQTHLVVLQPADERGPR